MTLPDGTRVLLVHATPTSDEANSFNPSRSDEEVADETAGTEADLICVGHFHMAMDRTVNRVRIINPGSVSNPQLVGPDLRAAYALLEADENGYHHQRFIKIDLRC